MDAPYSPKPQHYWDLTIRLFRVILQDTHWGGLTPLQRCSQCILQLRPTEQCSVFKREESHFVILWINKNVFHYQWFQLRHISLSWKTWFIKLSLETQVTNFNKRRLKLSTLILKQKEIKNNKKKTTFFYFQKCQGYEDTRMRTSLP